MKEETIPAALQEKLSNLKKLNDAIDLFVQLENEAVLKSLVEQKRNLAKDISQDYFKIMILSGLEEDIVQCVKNYSLFEDSAIQFSLLLKVSKNNVKVEIQNVNLPVDDVDLLDKMMDSYQKNTRKVEKSSAETRKTSKVDTNGKLMHASHQLSVVLKGKEVQGDNSTEIFVETIKTIGIERVRNLNMIFLRIPLIDTQKNAIYSKNQKEIAPGLYLNTNSNTRKKKLILDQIAKKLGVDIMTTII